ncbi:MAG: hypothetical protein ACI814_004269, partial [Mariniblastus sp.]
EDEIVVKLREVIDTLKLAENLDDPYKLEPVVQSGQEKFNSAGQDFVGWKEWKGSRSDDDLGKEATAELVQGKKADLPIVFPKGSFEVTSNGSSSQSAKLEAVRQYTISRETLKREVEGSVKYTAALEAQANAILKVGEWAEIDASVKLFVGAVIEAKGKSSISWEGVLLEASVSFFAGLKVNADAKVQLGSADSNWEIKGSLEGMAGVEAEASAKFKLTKDGFEAVAKFSAFVGCKAKAKVTSTITLFGREIVTKELVAEASIGVGVSGGAEIKVGVDNVTAGLAFSCTLGVGVGTSAKVSMNPVNITLTIIEIKDRIENLQPYLDGYKRLEMQSGLTELHVRRKRIIELAEKQLGKMGQN